MFPIKDDNPTESYPYVTIVIIVLCLVIYIVQYFIIDNSELNSFIINWAMTPDSFFSGESKLLNGPSPYVTIFSSMFLHGGILHLLGNLLFLWIYGNNVEDAMGYINFFFFYLICGIFAALIQAFSFPTSQIPMIGASGAIAGVLGSYFLLYPKAKVSTLVFLGFFITVIRIPAGILIAIWFFMQIFSAYSTDINSPGIAWYAHIGGFICGLLLTCFFKKDKIKLFSGKKIEKERPIKIRIRKKK